MASKKIDNNFEIKKVYLFGIKNPTVTFDGIKNVDIIEPKIYEDGNELEYINNPVGSKKKFSICCTLNKSTSKIKVYDKKGNLVYTIEDGKAKANFIEMQSQGNIAIVTKGLKEGQTIVSGGLIKIREGMPLKPEYETFDPIQKHIINLEKQQNGTAALDALLQKYQPNSEQDIRTNAQKKTDAQNKQMMAGGNL